MSTPRVSIIINNFNYEAYVGQAIESALAQTYAETEIIVVDDGSTDGSHAVIRGYEPRVTGIFKENGGQASALNAGFARSNGSLILFLDADDTLIPDAVATLVAAFQDSYAKIHFPLSVINAEGVEQGYLADKDQLPSGDLLDQMLDHGEYLSSPTSGNIFARRYLEQIMPIPEREWRGHADCYLLYLAPFFGAIGALDRPLGRYRIHGKNMTGFVQDGHVRSNGARIEVLRDFRQQRMLEEHCAKSGLTMRGNVAASYYHQRSRLISLKFGRSAHPVPGDRILRICVEGAKQAWRCADMTLSRKILNSTLLLLVGGLPTPLAERLMVHGAAISRFIK